MFEMYFARLMGIAHCIVPQLLPIQTDPQSTLIQAPSIELLASIMKPNQPLGGNQMPSIVQIIVPAHTLQHLPIIDKVEHNDDATTTTTTTTLPPLTLVDDTFNDSFSTPLSIESTSTVDAFRSSISVTQSPSSTTVLPEGEKDDEIDDIQLNEDTDGGDEYQENEEKTKKQRDRSDFRYVESFESEKSILQKFEPDPSDNETELKNVINENFQQNPSVLPVPKALSSSKDTENEDHEPQEVLRDQNISAPDM